MAIIWNTRDNGGGYIGYTNPGWSSFMNTYAYSLYPNGGFPSVNQWYYASYIETQIPYNDDGPFSVTYIITALGNGGQATDQITIPIIVDQTPDNFLVPESDDLLKSQNPVITPDSTITSYEIVINGIDVPIEIKSDKPILVEINDDQNWEQIREIE